MKSFQFYFVQISFVQCKLYKYCTHRHVHTRACTHTNTHTRAHAHKYTLTVTHKQKYTQSHTDNDMQSNIYIYTFPHILLMRLTLKFNIN